MKWKKITAIFIAVSVVCSLTACGQKDISAKNLMDDIGTVYVDDIGETNPSEQPLVPPEPPAANMTEEEQDAAVMDFAVRLFQKSLLMEMVPGQDTPNVLVSPTSVLMALSMTANGAEEETLAQMESVMGMSIANLNAYAAEYLKNLPNEEKCKLSLANSIWFRDEENRLTVEETFLQTNKTYYGADIYKAAFDENTVKDINTWVDENTDGLIKEVLKSIPADAVMYLINALVFDAKWQNEYHTHDVYEDVFYVNSTTTQNVEMMRSEETDYLEDDQATGFIKYYAGRKYAFAALLPNEDVSLYQYVSSLTGAHLKELLSEPEAATVYAFTPKFEIEYQVEMTEILKDMGMVDAFGAAANLKGIGTSTRGNLYISSVLHKTFLTLDELGTKAGAVTVVEVSDECAPMNIKNVKLDRPFLYMIIDCETSQPVFMGTVESVK